MDALIELLKFMLLGLIQGITEPLPVSSSAHVAIFNRLITGDEFTDLNLEIMVNFGSLIAIMIVFKQDLKQLFIGFFGYLRTKQKKYQTDFKYTLYLILATIPAGLVGLFFKETLEGAISQNFNIIGISLLITATLLWLIHKKVGTKGDNNITALDALIVGLFQVAALVPGISRSGSTITAGMFRDLKRAEALRFAFLLFIPISFATTILGVHDLATDPNLATKIIPYTVATIIAGITTYFSIRWFIGIVMRGKLMYFAYYAATLGLLVILASFLK